LGFRLVRTICFDWSRGFDSRGTLDWLSRSAILARVVWCSTRSRGAASTCSESDRGFLRQELEWAWKSAVLIRRPGIGPCATAAESTSKPQGNLGLTVGDHTVQEHTSAEYQRRRKDKRQRFLSPPTHPQQHTDLSHRGTPTRGLAERDYAPHGRRKRGEGRGA